MSTTSHKMHLCGLDCLSKLLVHSSFDAISFFINFVASLFACSSGTFLYGALLAANTAQKVL